MIVRGVGGRYDARPPGRTSGPVPRRRLAGRVVRPEARTTAAGGRRPVRQAAAQGRCLGPDARTVDCRTAGVAASVSRTSGYHTTRCAVRSASTVACRGSWAGGQPPGLPRGGGAQARPTAGLPDASSPARVASPHRPAWFRLRAAFRGRLPGDTGRRGSPVCPGVRRGVRTVSAATWRGSARRARRPRSTPTRAPRARAPVRAAPCRPSWRSGAASRCGEGGTTTTGAAGDRRDPRDPAGPDHTCGDAGRSPPLRPAGWREPGRRRGRDRRKARPGDARQSAPATPGTGRRRAVPPMRRSPALAGRAGAAPRWVLLRRGRHGLRGRRVVPAPARSRPIPAAPGVGRIVVAPSLPCPATARQSCRASVAPARR